MTLRFPARVGALLLFTLLAAYSTAAEPPPPPPLKIALAASDRLFFMCRVNSVNENDIAFFQGLGHINLWTKFMKGGKFEAVAPDQIRVVSSSLDQARADVYAFYRQYAAAAYIKSPLYDKGRQPIEYIVKTCAPEEGRSQVTEVKSMPENAYRTLTTDKDQILYFLHLLKTPLTDEQIAAFTSNLPVPIDAFERQAQVAKKAAAIRHQLATLNDAPVVMSGHVFIAPYDFASGTFKLPTLRKDVNEYTYSAPMSGERVRVLPRYDLMVSDQMATFKPASLDDAKRIERVRAAGRGTLNLKTFVQASGAAIDGDQLEIKGTVSAIEVLDDKGVVLFRENAN